MNRSLYTILLSQSLNILADNLLIPLFALFVARLTPAVWMVGVLFALQYISSTFCGFFVIRLRDAKGLDQRLLKTNYIIKAIAWLTVACSQNLPTLIVAQISIGAASAIGSPSFNALVSEHLDHRKHISEWGNYLLLYNTAIALGSIVGGFLLAFYGFTFIFIVMAILELVSLGLYSIFRVPT